MSELPTDGAPPPSADHAPSEGETPSSRRRGARGCLGCLAVVLLLLILLGGGIAGGYWWLTERWPQTPRGVAGERVELTVERGTSTRGIATRLAEHGLIDHPELFLAWLRLTGRQGSLQAGEYVIEPPVTPAELAETLSHGSFLRSVTLPEGWTGRQLAQRLAREDWISTPAEFVRLVERPVQEGWLPEPQPSAEGFLFPETYYFERDTGAEEILGHMLEMFTRRWQALEPDDRTTRTQQMTVRELVTLASLVEREARVAEEMPTIASVYYNRLDRGMRLQCDATVHYALGGNWDRPLTYADLEIDHPYNTYKYRGLPPGPIANPGGEALAAVLRPAQTDYLYYVYQGEGRHVFTRTHREHINATRAARRQREARD